MGIGCRLPVLDAYFHSPDEFRTSTESEAVIGRALCDVGLGQWSQYAFGR